MGVSDKIGAAVVSVDEATIVEIKAIMITLPFK